MEGTRLTRRDISRYMGMRFWASDRLPAPINLLRNGSMWLFGALPNSLKKACTAVSNRLCSSRTTNLIYAHLISLGQMARLAELHEQGGDSGPGAAET